MTRSVILSSALITCMMIMITACGGGEPQTQMPPPEVTVSPPLKKKVIEWDEYTGRFQAVERVEVRARVSGYLNEILFNDGDNVKKDDILFVIDQRPFKIALASAEAQYELAQKEFKRAQNLRNSGAISQEDFERRLQEFRVAKAGWDQATLEMTFTEIKAPISGRISRSRVDVGNLINGNVGNATLLSTIVSLDPIHFYFEASEQALLKYIRLDRSGERPGSQNQENPIMVKLQDEEAYTRIGRMDFVDNEVDLGTGTIQGRAIFTNADSVIYPGMFGRARLSGSGLYEAFLLPDTVIGTDQSRKFVMVVNEQNQAEMRFVKLGPVRDSGLRVIRDGLTESDRVIINGLQRARPGTPVTPKPGTIEEPGEDRLPSLPKPEAPAEDSETPVTTTPENQAG